MSSRVVFVRAPGAAEPDCNPIRVGVPAVQGAEPLLRAALLASAPAGAEEVVLDIGKEGSEAELGLLDYWFDLPEGDRRLVWGATGPLAGALLRFADRAALAFALVADADSEPARPLNGQTRSLLMAAHADTWTLAVDCGPDVDADVWRARLATVLRERWSVGRLEQPAAALDRLGRAWQVEASGLARLAAAPEAAVATTAPGTPGRGWLDAELPAMLRGADAGRHVAPAPSSAELQSEADGAPRVLRGKRSRLFLANDSHDSHQQMMGGRPLTEGELDAWEQGTAARMHWLGARDCRFVHLIGPAPQVVHGDDLPGSLAPSPSRPALQVLERLGAMVPPAPVLYPLDELADVRAVRSPFSLTDSHWNDLGAYVAYEALLAHLGDGANLRRIERDAVAFQDTVYVGDLGGKLRPERASTFLRARLDQPRARIVDDNRVRNHGRRVVYECPSAPESTCLVFGDSWAYPMMLFLAETFRRTVFLHRVNVVDRRPVDEERPDVVLVVMTERFCDAAPNDAGAVDFEAVAAAKIRKGNVVPLQQAGRRYEYLFSLALDRQQHDRPAVRLPASSVSGRRD